MSERNSMNEMFGQLKDYQVEAPLEVMELAIARANRKRKLRILVRWSVAFLLLAGAVMGWNWRNQSPEYVEPLEVKQKSVIVTPVKQKTTDEATSVPVPAVVPSAQRQKSQVSLGVSMTNQIVVPKVNESVVSTDENSSQIIESKQIVDSSSVTPEVLTKPLEEQQVKKSKTSGQRKLKLIIPQP